jgi:hypothetical protein
MERHEGLQTDLSIALHTGLKFVIIMDPYAGPQTALNIALHRGL